MFQLPNCTHKFHKQSFIVSSLFRFLKYFFWIGFCLYSPLCAAVNFDFILILINFDSILCNSNFDFYIVLQLITMFFFNWGCMYVWYVPLNFTYLLTYTGQTTTTTTTTTTTVRATTTEPLYPTSPPSAALTTRADAAADSTSSETCQCPDQTNGNYQHFGNSREP